MKIIINLLIFTGIFAWLFILYFALFLALRSFKDWRRDREIRARLGGRLFK